VLSVSVEPFRRLSAETRRGVVDEVERLAGFLDAPVELSVAA
jgi:hypothetical protein